MGGQQHTLNAVLSAVLISVAACSPPGRAPRRLAPSPDRPISLHELQYSCSVQGWRSCYQMATDLLNVNHSLRLSILSCLSNPNNSAYETRPSSAHFNKNSATSSDNGSGGEGNGTSNSSLAEEPTAAAEELRCIISGSKKKRIRREVYCELLFDLDQAVRVIVTQLGFLRDLNCISTYPDPGYLTPHQLIDSIQLWHEGMIDTHKRCCESEDETSRIFSRDLNRLYGTVIAGEFGILCPLSVPIITWDSYLNKLSLLMFMLEQMQEELGRRRTCLRGCVSENQVLCTNILPYLFLPL